MIIMMMMMMMMMMIIIFIQEYPLSVMTTGIKGVPVIKVHKRKNKIQNSKILEKVQSRKHNI